MENDVRRGGRVERIARGLLLLGLEGEVQRARAGECHRGRARLARALDRLAEQGAVEGHRRGGDADGSGIGPLEVARFVVGTGRGQRVCERFCDSVFGMRARARWGVDAGIDPVGRGIRHIVKDPARKQPGGLHGGSRVIDPASRHVDDRTLLRDDRFPGVEADRAPGRGQFADGAQDESSVSRDVTQRGPDP